MSSRFDEWVRSLPPSHWSKYDLAACELGWRASTINSAKVSFHRGIAVGIVFSLLVATITWIASLWL